MSIELTIVTPEREVFRGPVERVVLPGSEGDFGVLEKHERFLAPLKIGEARFQEGGGEHRAAMSDGFAQVTPEKVVVLVDTCELAGDIDVARAERARERAERELESVPKPPTNGEEEARFRQYELALQRALVRIQVAGRR